MSLMYSTHNDKALRQKQTAPALEMDAEIMKLWRMKFDSQKIAELIQQPEYLVDARISRVLERARDPR